jgi:hypothetical protein
MPPHQYELSMMPPHQYDVKNGHNRRVKVRSPYFFNADLTISGYLHIHSIRAIAVSMTMRYTFCLSKEEVPPKTIPNPEKIWEK